MSHFLGFRVHVGEPENPTKLRGYTGSLFSKAGEDETRNNYTDHQIARWYGISFRLRWFVGLWVFGWTAYPSEVGPVPPY